MMEQLMLIFVIAVTAEGVTEYIKLMVENGKVNRWMATSLFVSVILTLTSGVDVYTALGVPFIYPVIGQILTGIFLSRGSNYLFSLVDRLKNPIPKTVVNVQPQTEIATKEVERI